MISRYAAWARRQASTMNCGGPAAGAALGAAALALGLWWFVARYLLVIEQVAAAGAGAGLALLATYALLVLGGRRGERWKLTRCQDCRAAQAVAEVTYANGLRGDTVRTCGPCWQRAEAQAAAAAGLPAPSWDVDTSGPGLPRITEAAPASADPEPAGCARQPVPVPAAPDNAPAAGPLPPELAAYEGRLIPPSHWTRGHP